MAWARFPYPDRSYAYTPRSLEAAWARLHAGDAEPFPQSPQVVDAWIAFHAGEFEAAVDKGLAAGVDGYSAANKSACIHATYLERAVQKKRARLLEVAERCEEQQELEPLNAAGFYWHAYALGRYAQDISVAAALAQGIATRARASLDAALELAPEHADAHIALGVYHAEIIDKIGALVGKLTYGASREAPFGTSRLRSRSMPAPQSRASNMRTPSSCSMAPGSNTTPCSCASRRPPWPRMMQWRSWPLNARSTSSRGSRRGMARNATGRNIWTGAPGSASTRCIILSSTTDRYRTSNETTTPSFPCSYGLRQCAG